MPGKRISAPTAAPGTSAAAPSTPVARASNPAPGRKHRRKKLPLPPGNADNVTAGRVLLLTGLDFSVKDICRLLTAPTQDIIASRRRLAGAAFLPTMPAVCLAAAEAGAVMLDPSAEADPEVSERIRTTMAGVQRLKANGLIWDDRRTLADYTRHYLCYAGYSTTRHRQGPFVSIQAVTGINAPITIILAAGLAGRLTAKEVAELAPTDPGLDLSSALLPPGVVRPPR
jgi:hypothetical protein